MTNTTTTTTLAIGQMIVFEGEVREIVGLKGRWVRLCDGSNISRADAAQGRQDYVEDAECLGEELENSEDEPDHDPIAEPDDEADTEADEEEATGYQGSMLRLRERLAEGAYSKAKNGNPCCGDRVAALLGTLPPAQVISACILAMALPTNPYAHLNVGQQSMNLRNKLRGCFKREEFGFGVLVEAVEQIKEEAEALQATAE